MDGASVRMDAAAPDAGTREWAGLAVIALPCLLYSMDLTVLNLAIGVWISSYSAGAAIGPVVAGLMLEYFWWGSVFLLGVPVMLMLLALGPALLPEYRDPDAGRLDMPSAVLSLLSVLAVLACIHAIKQLAEHGWSTGSVLTLGIGVACGTAFWRRQHRLADPMVDPSLLARPARSSSALPLAAAFVLYSLGLAWAAAALCLAASAGVALSLRRPK